MKDFETKKTKLIGVNVDVVDLRFIETETNGKFRATLRKIY